jgi:hypothetical protein
MNSLHPINRIVAANQRKFDRVPGLQTESWRQV